MGEISGRKFATIAIVATYCIVVVGSLVLTILKIMDIAVFLASISGLGTITLYIVKAYFDDKDRLLSTNNQVGTVLKSIIALMLVLGLLIPGAAMAQEEPVISWGDIIQQAPAVKSGAFYNINDSKFQVINSLSVVEYKFASIDAGYANQGIICASINFDLVKLEALGVKFPFFKDIVAGAGWTAGFKRITQDSEFVTGPSIVLKVKF